MLTIRCDPSVPCEVCERVGSCLDRVARGWTGAGEVFVYCVPHPHGARELIIRVSTRQGAVPVLFPLEAGTSMVETALRGVLMREDL
jgi:hypothetical protein